MNSLNRVIKWTLATGLTLALTLTAHAQVFDRIVAVVDTGVILQSDLETRLSEVVAQARARGESLEITETIRDQVIEQLILEEAQVQLATRAGLRIDDARVNQTLSQIAATRGTDLLGLRQRLIEEGSSFLQFRNQVQRELLISAIRDREVRNRIRVSESEVDRFLETTAGQISTAPELLLAQIVVGLPANPSNEELQAAGDKINQLRVALLEGAPFGQIASRFSDAPEAKQGGDLGWRNILELSPVFTEALKDAQKNTLIGPIQSPGGLHLIAVRDRRGDQAVVTTEFDARHILIKPDAVRSKEKTRALLENIRLELDAGGDFATLAKRYSEDPISAAKGGNLGWVRVDQLVPEFAQAMESLPLNTISEVVETSFGLHIIEVLASRETDISEEQLRNRARQILAERKFSQELEAWIRQVRADAFVELK